MKLLKTLTLGTLAAASIGTASAQTTLHICGSTAFRNGASAAIIDYLSSNLAPGSSHVYAGTTVATTSEGILSAGAALYANGTVGTTGSGTATLIVETYWTGSLAGVVDVTAQNTTGLYIDPSNLTTAQLSQINSTAGYATAGSQYGGGVEFSGTVTTKAYIPDMAFSDSYQGTISKELATGQFVNSSTPVGSYSSISALATACAGSSIKQAGTSSGAGGAGFEGIVPFEWVIGNVQNSAVTSAISNISQQAARGLITDGYVPQSYLTGTDNGTTDTANYFYLVGRNEDSGTRIGALSESQFGVTFGPVQFEPNDTTSPSATTPLTSLQEYPVTALNTEANIIWNTPGHSGYSSGGNVAAALGSPENATALAAFGGQSSENTGASYLIGYVGATDAATAIADGGHALTYNGVPFSVAAVENGQYTFWTYEHCYRLSAAGTAVAGLADGIADDVYNNDADVASNGTHSTTSGAVAGGILDNASSPVLVQRSLIEGGIISNY